MKTYSILVLSLVAGFWFPGCQSRVPKTQAAAAATPATPPPARAGAEAKIVAQENSASLVTEIAFDKGSSSLNHEAQQKLDAMMQKARRQGVIDDIKIIAWADSEYPSLNIKRLPKAERVLADQRGRILDTYLRAQTRGVAIDRYNMAERPNSLQQVLATNDARIKKSLEEAGIATTAHDLKFPENASRAMIMVILK